MLLLFSGILMTVIGYYRTNTPPPRVEYRYIPKSFTDEQFERLPLMGIYGDLFTKADPWAVSIGYPATFFRKKEEF